MYVQRFVNPLPPRLTCSSATVALAGLAFTFFLTLVLINGYVGNWILRQGSSPDTVVSSLFFKSHDYSPWTTPADGLFPFEAIGQAVDFASKVADNLEAGGDTIMVDTPSKEEESITSYRMVRKKSKSIAVKVASRFRSLVEHFLLGISMTGIGSFLWMLVTLPFM